MNESFHTNHQNQIRLIGIFKIMSESENTAPSGTPVYDLNCLDADGHEVVIHTPSPPVDMQYIAVTGITLPQAEPEPIRTITATDIQDVTADKDLVRYFEKCLTAPRRSEQTSPAAKNGQHPKQN